MTRGGTLLSSRGFSAISDLTAGDGPFALYLADKRLSLAQFEAYLEANGPVSPDELANAELASRGKYVRTIGMLRPFGSGTTAGLHWPDMSHKGLAFSEENAGWQHILYNMGKALTTGSTWFLKSTQFVRWNPSG